MKRNLGRFFSMIGVITAFYLCVFYGLPFVLSEWENAIVHSALRREGEVHLRGAMNSFQVDSMVTKERGRYVYRYSLGNATENAVAEWDVLSGLMGVPHETVRIPAGKALTLVYSSDWGPVVVEGALAVTGKNFSGTMRMPGLIPRWSEAYIPDYPFSGGTPYAKPLRQQIFEWEERGGER